MPEIQLPSITPECKTLDKGIIFCISVTGPDHHEPSICNHARLAGLVNCAALQVEHRCACEELLHLHSLHQPKAVLSRDM